MLHMSVQSDMAGAQVTGRLSRSQLKGIEVHGLLVPAGEGGEMRLEGHWRRKNTGSDAPVAIVASWTCKCTMANPGSAKKCGTCGNAAPPARYTSRYDAVAPCSLQLAAGGDSFAGQWSRGPTAGGWLGVRSDMLQDFEWSAAASAGSSRVLSVVRLPAGGGTAGSPFLSTSTLPRWSECRPFSVEAWIKPDGAGAVAGHPQAVLSCGAFGLGLTPDNRVAAWRREGVSKRGGSVYHSAAMPRISWWTAAAAAADEGTPTFDVATSATAIPTGAFTHIAAQYDGKTLSIVVNGATAASVTSANLSPTNDAPFVIGGEVLKEKHACDPVAALGPTTQLTGGYKVVHAFAGCVCDVRVWSRAQPPMPAHRGGAESDPLLPASLYHPRSLKHLEGYWPLVGDPDYAADASAHARHLVAHLTSGTDTRNAAAQLLHTPDAPCFLVGPFHSSAGSLKLAGAAHMDDSTLLLSPCSAAWHTGKLGVRNGFTMSLAVSCAGGSAGSTSGGAEALTRPANTSLWGDEHYPGALSTLRVVLQTGSYWSLRPLDAAGHATALQGPGGDGDAAATEAEEAVTRRQSFDPSTACVYVEVSFRPAGVLELAVMCTNGKGAGQVRCLGRSWQANAGAADLKLAYVCGLPRGAHPIPTEAPLRGS